MAVLQSTEGRQIMRMKIGGRLLRCNQWHQKNHNAQEGALSKCGLVLCRGFKAPCRRDVVVFFAAGRTHSFSADSRPAPSISGDVHLRGRLRQAFLRRSAIGQPPLRGSKGHLCEVPKPPLRGSKATPARFERLPLRGRKATSARSESSPLRGRKVTSARCRKTHLCGALFVKMNGVAPSKLPLRGWKRLPLRGSKGHLCEVRKATSARSKTSPLRGGENTRTWSRGAPKRD